jgi:cytochrome c peroxidase
MQRNLIALALASGMLLLSGAALAVDLRDRANAVFDPIPGEIPKIADNPVTPDKIHLGRMLFLDPRLSASGLISCNTCHNLGTGGDDNVPVSVGHRWQKGPRNAPTVFNSVFNVDQFWDGRADDLKAQAKGPVQAGVEMANTPENVETTLRSMPEYVALFGRAFPGEKQATTFDNMARAIEAFEATLVTPASPFDRFLNGEDAALDARGKQGLALFMDKGCITCHNGVNIGGNSYFRFGLVESPGADILPPGDKGRQAVTMAESDAYVFRVAPLRNVALTAPYFHSGAVWDLERAVSVMASVQLGIELSDDEAGAIVAFLDALTGEAPPVEYPILPPETADTPRPRF